MTQVICGGRGSGRTTKLVQMAAANHGYIVCHAHQECRRIAEHARALGLDINFPITYDEFIDLRHHMGVHIKEYYVDNVEKLVQYIARGVPVHAMTVLHPEYPHARTPTTFESLDPDLPTGDNRFEKSRFMDQVMMIDRQNQFNAEYFQKQYMQEPSIDSEEE